MRRYASPLFQHRHYVALALILAECNARTKVHFADKLAGTNPSFDRERFLAACDGAPLNHRDNQAKREATPAMSLSNSRALNALNRAEADEADANRKSNALERVKLASHSERCIARHEANRPW